MSYVCNSRGRDKRSRMTVHGNISLFIILWNFKISFPQYTLLVWHDSTLLYTTETRYENTQGATTFTSFSSDFKILLTDMYAYICTFWKRWNGFLKLEEIYNIVNYDKQFLPKLSVGTIPTVFKIPSHQFESLEMFVWLWKGFICE